jgi:fumarylacetoacetate (FAA) hydrolase family protein
MDLTSYASDVPPRDVAHATLVARVFDPEAGGPCVAAVRGDTVVDLTHVEPTVADLLDRNDAADIVRTAPGGRGWPLAELLRHTLERRPDVPHLLAPIDLQVIKAAGVTFARSMLERVVEERAAGDPGRAEALRATLTDLLGGAFQVRPGSAEADRVKRVLLAEGLWSQYLEVGIGPDPEIFTKAPVLSAVGTGAEIGVLARSTWNNPEPELVLAVSSAGRPVAATLGNDVNLRDFEGRSALLLTEAKDNNASCAIGPFLRLFDADFTLDDACAAEISLRVTGPDGYTLAATSPVSEISRHPLDLVTHACGPHHRYPDGFMLFTGTMFAPTADRHTPGHGFTHQTGDVVHISSPRLGALVNVVTSAEEAPDWTFGVRALMRNLADRGLLDRTAARKPPHVAQPAPVARS